MLDFPSSPTNGQKYPATPQAGIPTYTWDGEKWITAPGAIGGAKAVLSDGSIPMTAQLKVVNPPAVATDAAAKGYVDAFAAPMDALAYSGMQINGSCDVSQEFGFNGNGVLVTQSVNRYVCDGWIGVNSCATGVAQFTVSAMGSTPNMGNHINTLQMWPTTVQATMGASDHVRFNNIIEGYRFSRVGWGTSNAVPVTIGFWFRASKAGDYRVVMMSQGGDVTPWMPFTLAVAGTTFQWVTITFQPMTTGTWLKDNRAGAHVIFELTSNATPNLMASLSDYVSITGLIVLPGLYAPSAARAPFIMRPFNDEIVLCQRYYEKTYPMIDLPGAVYGNYNGSGTSLMEEVQAPGAAYKAIHWPFTVLKRVAPTSKSYSPQTGAVGTIAVAGIGDVPAAVQQNSESSVVFVVNNTTINSFTNIACHAIADARI
jgi:hypothetical protein